MDGVKCRDVVCGGFNTGTGANSRAIIRRVLALCLTQVIRVLIVGAACADRVKGGDEGVLGGCVDGICILQAQCLQDPVIHRRAGGDVLGRAEFQREIPTGAFHLGANQLACAEVLEPLVYLQGSLSLLVSRAEPL